MTETWMPVVGYEKEYMVSDQGRVMSVTRKVRCSGGGFRTQKGRYLKIQRGKGRASVTLSGKQHRIHTLVLNAFVGPCPPGQEGCHANGDGWDNRLENLRWDTRKANVADAIRHETWARGTMLPQSVLDEAKVVEIRKRRGDGALLKDLADEFDVHIVTIHDIVHRKTWAHL